MKITKRQLRRIIKEEKAKLVENQNASRMQGMYSDVAAIDALHDAFDELLMGTTMSAQEDLGGDDEADEAAVSAVTLAVAHIFQASGLMAQYQALIRTLG